MGGLLHLVQRRGAWAGVAGPRAWNNLPSTYASASD